VIVLDASAVAEVVLRRSAAATVERRVHDMQETQHAPHFIDLEVAHVVRRYALRGEIDGERGRAALEDLTVYDAAYVALAEILDAPLVTRDGRLAASSGHRARIELL
jgi:predicted nucleic acid-binding protein